MPPPYRELDQDPGAHDGSTRADELPAAQRLVELNALLGRGTRYVGKLHFEGRIRIEGRFEGEIRGDDVLIIGEGADVEGDIEVGVCIVTGGRVNGSIRARQAIELHVPAVVHGDLQAPAIFIDRGVQFEGSCKMAALDDEPTLDGGDDAPAVPAAPATDASSSDSTADAEGDRLPENDAP